MKAFEPHPSSSDKELVFIRKIQAPPALIFKMWTEAAHLANWWGPEGFSISTQAFDATPGGIWQFTMCGPDGREHLNKLRFVNIKKPECLEFQHLDPLSDEVLFQVVGSFQADGNHTILTMRMVFESPEKLKQVMEHPGAKEGIAATLDRLKKIAEQINP